MKTAVFVLFCALVVAFVHGVDFIDRRCMAFDKNIQYRGDNLHDGKISLVMSRNECCRKCYLKQMCTKYTYYEEYTLCLLKTGRIGAKTVYRLAFSGIKRRLPTPALTGE